MSRYHDVITIVTDDGLVAAIKELTAELGYPPTLREVGERVGLTAPSTVHRRLARLRREGRVTGGTRETGGTRTLAVVRTEPPCSPCGCSWDYVDSGGFCACCEAHIDDPAGMWAEQGESGLHGFADCVGMRLNPHLDDEQRRTLEQATAEVEAAIPDPPRLLHDGQHEPAYLAGYARGWREGFRAGVRS